ncbi:hypothetical protein [Vibrio parahaemolyticus]|uniref:hypothetical protein n=1 Tax=Vibrio parahaemolyticus TaxID=670 RepID=UPI0022B3DEB1|nr:hypothetical protein [Vibrio parahaemolyticus]MCZ6297528.1 hypothetical protein [Vibrio parahaemolyticus]
MPMFEIYATGSYKYTKLIFAETREEAEEIFSADPPGICYRCGYEGIELDELKPNAVIKEIEDDEE